MSFEQLVFFILSDWLMGLVAIVAGIFIIFAYDSRFKDTRRITRVIMGGHYIALGLVFWSVGFLGISVPLTRAMLRFGLFILLVNGISYNWDYAFDNILSQLRRNRR